MTDLPPADVDILDELMIMTLAGYGLFMLNWSLLESVIEVAIMKRLDLHPLEGAIITSSLGFQARANILKSFLALDTAEIQKRQSRCSRQLPMTQTAT